MFSKIWVSRDSSVGIAKGWTVKVWFPAAASFHTGSGSHTASNPMSTEGSSTREYSGQGVKVITHINLVPRSRMVELYFHSPYVFMAWYLIDEA
jgi:hypothetical protein